MIRRITLRLSPAVLFFLISAFIVPSLAVSCSDPQTGKRSPNMCINLPETRFCVSMANAGEPAGNWTCAECNSDDPWLMSKPDGDCECGPMTYCAKFGEYRGSCQPKANLWQPCALFSPRIDNLPQNYNYSLVTRDMEPLFCGLLHFDSHNKMDGLEWIGICTQGQCHECTTYEVAITHTPTSQCGDRICIGGRFYRNMNAWFLSWGFFFSDLGVFGLATNTGLIFTLGACSLVTMIVAYIRRKTIFAVAGNKIFGDNYGVHTLAASGRVIDFTSRGERTSRRSRRGGRRRGNMVQSSSDEEDGGGVTGLVSASRSPLLFRDGLSNLQS